jgi:hypothetical protein
MFLPSRIGENEMKTFLMIALIIVLTLITAACGRRNEPVPASQLKPAETVDSEVAVTLSSEPIVPPTTKDSARSDPAAIVLAYQEALNAHDLDSALALFSDDLEYYDLGNGNKVEWLMRFIQRSGSIDEFQFEAIVEDEKITSLTELAVSIGSYNYRNPQYRGYFRRTAPTMLA